MTWTRNSTSGTLTHAGIYRSTWHGDGLRAPTSGRVTLQSATYTHRIRVVCPCSTDGRTGWEVGIMGDGFAVATNLSIRRIVMGVPSAPVQQIAHGLAAGTTFTLQVDYTDNTITASIIGAGTTVTLSHTNTTEPTFITFRSLAIASDIDGATVDRPQVCELVRDAATIRDALVSVGDDGSVYASFDGTSMTPIASRVLGQSGQVSIDQYLGTLYAIGGGKSRKIDLVNRTTTPWTPTAGSLPGANGAGTTDAQGVVFWGTRAVVFRSQGNPNGLYFSAIDDPDDFDTGSAIFGAAFVRNMPEPVVSVTPLSDRELLVCCERSTYRILGDAGLGASETLPVLGGTGSSGPAATVGGLTPGGAFVHSPEGVYTVTGLNANGLSDDVLTKHIAISRDDIGTYTVTALRDATNQRCHVFITPTSSTTQGVHAVYEEAVGGFQAGAAGWFLDTFPAEYGPTAAAVHKGRVYLGGHDGVIRVFDADATDDDGEDIDIRLPVRVIHQGLTEGDVRLDRTMPQLTRGSGTVTVKLFGAPTAEYAMDPANRTTLWSTTYAPLGAPITRKGSDSALLLEFSSTAADWAIEQVDVMAAPVAIARRHVRAAVTAGAPCTYPTVTTPEEPPDGGSGPGAPGGVVVGPVPLVDDWIFYDGFEFIVSPLAFPSNGASEIPFREPLEDGNSGGRDHTSPPTVDPFQAIDKTGGGFSSTNPWLPGVYENVQGGDSSYMDHTEPPSEI